MSRNVRNLSAKLYNVDYISTVSGKPVSKTATLTIASPSKQLKAICESEGCKPSQVAILGVSESVKRYQIIDLNAAIAAGYVVEVSDEPEE